MWKCLFGNCRNRWGSDKYWEVSLFLFYFSSNFWVYLHIWKSTRDPEISAANNAHDPLFFLIFLYFYFYFSFKICTFPYLEVCLEPWKQYTNGDHDPRYLQKTQGSHSTYPAVTDWVLHNLCWAYNVQSNSDGHHEMVQHWWKERGDREWKRGS